MTTLDHAIPAAEEQPWFYRIEDTADPWCHWFRMLRFPRHGPLDAEIEHDIEEVCRAADKRRLAIVPRTKRFAEMWATFRQHHERLEAVGSIAAIDGWCGARRH
jgi:hypothetical protein